jgi:hypothetical protein
MPAGDPPDRWGLSAEYIDRMAAAAHEIYGAALRGSGYVSTPSGDDEPGAPRGLRPYATLSEDEKTPSRRMAAAIPDKLMSAGYSIVASAPMEQPIDFPPDLLEHLAEDEHARWVRARLADGWRYAPTTDKRRKLHASIIRWGLHGTITPGGTFTPEELAVLGPGELSENEREKDRVMVRAIPRILARVGLAIRKRGNAGTTEPAGERHCEVTPPDE